MVSESTSYKKNAASVLLGKLQSIYHGNMMASLKAMRPKQDQPLSWLKPSNDDDAPPSTGSSYLRSGILKGSPELKINSVLSAKTKRRVIDPRKIFKQKGGSFLKSKGHRMRLELDSKTRTEEFVEKMEGIVMKNVFKKLKTRFFMDRSS